MLTSPQSKFKQLDAFILAAILIVAFCFRLYNINVPLADYHSWRQVDTAAVARNFARDGIDLLKPRYDDLSSIQTGKENPQGIRMVEFPIYNALFATTYKLMPFIPLEIHGRLFTALFSLIIIAVLYYFLLKEHSRMAAIAGALTYSSFPFFVFFSRVILPETSALMFAFVSIFFLYKHTESTSLPLKILFYTVSVLAFAFGLLTKPTVIFYVIALAFLFIRRYGFNLPKQLQFYLFFVLAGLPLLWWRNYILQFPEGIPPSDWLITHVNTYQGLQNIFFRPAFFRWIFYERIVQIIFGGYMTVFFVMGLVSKQKKLFLYSMILSGITYLFVFQGGNVQHEYYQTIILPALAIAVGIGFSFFIQNSKYFVHPVILYPALILVISSSYLFSYYRVKDYYHIPEDLVQISSIVKTLTKPDDRIVTDRLGDTTLLYLCDRKGAPAIYRDFAELKKLGYSYVITQDKKRVEETKTTKQYPVIFENERFGLIKLL